ncbi:citrulline utilization hydrolase CtlX [Variovorax sp. J31P207]|uniref:citrulline utilization hydrolase CtlX n=1 Tax=Variovorax sp. J31P207 TaxID=3053510 RepID=UPI002574EC6D|nr:arginine deiminase-related protein [Variovorax sp. J31P207]MDM0071599.1 arginine deiminase-related protein [Variovorax sp. J31P207]
MPSIRSIQAPRAVVMIRPHAFTPNPETAADNTYQTSAQEAAAEAIAQAAYDEVTGAAQRLEMEGVRVHLFEDDGQRDTPDSVFPNNWFSTHPGGHVAVYPMYSPSRRRERRAEVIEMLKAEYRVQDVIDYSGLEQDGLFLEGTGAMVLDHVARVAYTARSNRADPVALERFSTHFNFEPIVFDTADAAGRQVYHTNVLMCVATEFAMVGFDLIPDAQRASQVRARLEESGREVIALSMAQVAEFAGNAIELSGRDGRILALSKRAYDSLDKAQKAAIHRSARLVPLAVPTIEMAGGSVRCMIAGIHLASRRHESECVEASRLQVRRPASSPLSSTC